MNNVSLIFVFVGLLAAAYLIAKFFEWQQKFAHKYEEEQREKEQRKKEQRRKDMEVWLALLEVLRQAKVMGDQATVDAITANRYDGKLPERRNDGLWMSIYDDLRILPIHGMKYCGDLSAYVGEFDGVVVPEPDNEWDKYAIQVKCQDGRLLGYVAEQHTDVVRWLVGVPQPLADEPTIFAPYRIKGFINAEEAEDGTQSFSGCIYIKRNETNSGQ